MFSFAAFIDNEGGVTLDENRLYFLGEEFSEEDIKSMASGLASEEGDEGYLSDYRLRFMKKHTDNGVIIAFCDASNESITMISLVKDCLILGAAAMVVIFLASVMVARWAVKPVEVSWSQQKQFLGDASHELKTPLTVILSNAEMILTRGDGKYKKWAETIKSEAMQMKYLTEQLLLLARTEDSVHSKAIEKTDISYLVTDCILMFEPLAFESGRELSYNVEEGVSSWGEKTSLSMVVSILIDNAIKYSYKNTKITVNLCTRGRWAVLEVRNHGAHIDDEKMEHIFERFYRGDYAKESEGHGLGLAIARNIITAHKGSIWADSFGEDNCFTVQIPLARGEQIK